MTFVEYLKQWMEKYPRLDVYYHLKFIEQAYKEEMEHVQKETAS